MTEDFMSATLPSAPRPDSPLHPIPAYAVFFHCVYTPNNELTVPASPTKPSSNLTQPSAALGIVISQRSLTSWRVTALASLSSFFFSTTPSASFSLSAWRRSRRRYSAYSDDAMLHEMPVNHARYASRRRRCDAENLRIAVASSYTHHQPTLSLMSPQPSRAEPQAGRKRALTTVALSSSMYAAYPSCRPMAVYRSTGSMDFASLATAAALKCSTNLPTRMSLRVRPNCFLVVSKGAMDDCAWFVRYRYHARKREKYCSVRSTLSRPTAGNHAVSLPCLILRIWGVVAPGVPVVATNLR